MPPISSVMITVDGAVSPACWKTASSGDASTTSSWSRYTGTPIGTKITPMPMNSHGLPR